MKTRVDIVTGFLGAGKTTYINTLLQDKNLERDRVVVLQFENGEYHIPEGAIKENFQLVNAQGEGKALDAPYLEYIVEQYSPNKIIIEYNGTLELEKVFRVFENRSLRKKCFLGNIVCLVDAATFWVYRNNLGGMFQNQITFADHIILNKILDGQETQMLQTEKSIHLLNKKAKLFEEAFYGEKLFEETEINFQGASIYDNGSGIKLSNILLGAFIILAILYLIFSVLHGLNNNGIHMDFSGFEAFQLIFISILMQTFPFMLVGVFVSSIMQVFLSNETIVKFFPKKYGLGFLTAMFGGLLLPVCECAIVPVTAGLVKKGVSLPVAVTFMLAAPIINPIVIVSTLYAFPGHPEITIYRIYFGLVIALAVGIILTLFPESKGALLEQANLSACDCIYCSTDSGKEQGIGGKLRLMFLHAGEEFFSAGKYLVVGAILTSLIQTAVSKDIFLQLWGKDGLGLGIMMITAFLFSVCSTSDAFIARSFWNSFSTSSIMGFLVFGPMMDIKNLFMLFSSFRKTFVIKLTLLITGIAFVLLYVLTSLII